MKFIKTISVLALSLVLNTAMAQDRTLPTPERETGTSFGTAISNRHSTRSFDSVKQVSDQTLSNLLWSAAGVNRSNGYRSNPTAMNRQEIDVYVFSKDGVYLYLSTENMLKKVADGDKRQLVAAQQDFVLSAPLSLVMVANIDKLGEQNERNLMMGAVDAGIVCENINLFCAANGLATVPRASMDAKGIKELLNLSETQIPIMNNPIGYSAE